jgi:hypothetical protein
MSAHDRGAGDALHLNDEDVAYLLNVLRNATQPVTTQQLIDLLRRQAGEPQLSLASASGEGMV